MPTTLVSNLWEIEPLHLAAWMASSRPARATEIVKHINVDSRMYSFDIEYYQSCTIIQACVSSFVESKHGGPYERHAWTCHWLAYGNHSRASILLLFWDRARDLSVFDLLLCLVGRHGGFLEREGCFKHLLESLEYRSFVRPEQLDVFFPGFSFLLYLSLSSSLAWRVTRDDTCGMLDVYQACAWRMVNQCKFEISDICISICIVASAKVRKTHFVWEKMSDRQMASVYSVLSYVCIS